MKIDYESSEGGKNIIERKVRKEKKYIYIIYMDVKFSVGKEDKKTWLWGRWHKMRGWSRAIKISRVLKLNWG